MSSSALIALAIGLSPHAQEVQLAAESDPPVMGRMQGTPVPPEARGTVAAIEFVDFPRSRWAVCRIRDLFHTIDVSRRLAPFIPLDYVLPNELAEIRPEIDALTFTPRSSPRSGAIPTWCWAT